MDHNQLVEEFVQSLPSLQREQVTEECCPICLVPFVDLFDDAPGEQSSLNRGVTKLPSCQHIFCKSDLLEWIRSMHGSCPSCRRVFLDIRPPSDSDGESDGGEYIPNPDEEDEDEDDAFFLDTDGFTEAEEFDVEMEELDLSIYQNWEPSDVDDMEDADGSSEWGLTDGDTSNSDGDLSLESEEMSANDDTNVVVNEDGQDLYEDGDEEDK